MQHKTKVATADKAAVPRIPAELLEQLIPCPVTPGQLEDIFQQFKKAFIERALVAEMSQHLVLTLKLMPATRPGPLTLDPESVTSISTHPQRPRN